MESNPSEQFNIRWKNYSTVLQSVFRDLLREERMVDVTLACEGGFIKCHRIVLSACSSYFENLLNELQEPHVVIFMKDVKLWELEALIHFMYNGEVSVKQNRLEALVRAAESLHIRGLSTTTGPPESKNKDDYHSSKENNNIPTLPRNVQRRPSAAPGPPRLDRRPSLNHPVTTKRPYSGGGVSGGGTSENGPPKLMRIKANSDRLMQFKGTSPQATTSSAKSVVKVENKDAVKNERENTDESGEMESFQEGEGDSTETGEEYYPDDSQGEDAGQWSYQGADEGSPSGDDMNGTGHPGIIDPPIVGPVVDAEDRANRLEKATGLALSGITVRQAAAHYGIPRTTLCAYMKRRGLTRMRGGHSGGGGALRQQVGKSSSEKAPNNSAQQFQDEGEESDFPFLGGLAELMAKNESNDYEEGETEQYDYENAG